MNTIQILRIAGARHSTGLCFLSEGKPVSIPGCKHSFGETWVPGNLQSYGSSWGEGEGELEKKQPKRAVAKIMALMWWLSLVSSFIILFSFFLAFFNHFSSVSCRLSSSSIRQAGYIFY